MQQINKALKDGGLFDGDLRAKEFAYNARLAAQRTREAADSFGTGTPCFRWAVMIACSLEGYADELDRGTSEDAEVNDHLPRE